MSGLGPDKIAGQAKVIGLGLAQAWTGLSQGFKGMWETIRFEGAEGQKLVQKVSQLIVWGQRHLNSCNPRSTDELWYFDYLLD